jgi:hypothetical protein
MKAVFGPDAAANRELSSMEPIAVALPDQH